MKVLQFNKNFFAIVGIYPFHRIKKPYDELVKRLIVSFMLITLATLFFCSVTYVLKHFTTISRLSAVMIEIIITFGSIAVTGAYTSTVMNKDKMDDFEARLQAIVDKST